MMSTGCTHTWTHPVDPCPWCEQNRAGKVFTPILKMPPQQESLTIRQQAVLMAPASEIADIVPSTAKDCAMFLGITVSEYAQDYLANYLRAVGKARCMWADAVLRAEKESRE